MKRVLPDYPTCLICGKDVSFGLHMSFYREEDAVVSSVIIPESFAGYPGVVHGGIISAILDEALGRIVASIAKRFVVTGDLHVRFHHPLLVNTPVSIRAVVLPKEKPHHRFWSAEASMVDQRNSEIYASAKARFFPIAEDKQAEILSQLTLQGCNRPVTIEDL